MSEIIISPSILSADFANLASEVQKSWNAGAKWLHLDIMDGNFVQNISFGSGLIESIRPHSAAIFDTHLMINDPIKYIENFAKAGSNYITFHIESNSNPMKVIEKIRDCNAKVGITLKPSTPLSAIEKLILEVDLILIMTVDPGFSGQKFDELQVEKIKYLSQIRRKHNMNFKISVDGGINHETAKICKSAGANVLVSGSYLFGSEDFQKSVEILKQMDCGVRSGF